MDFCLPFVARLNLLHFNRFSTYLKHWRNLLDSITFLQPLFLFASPLMSEFVSPAIVAFPLFLNEYSMPCNNTCYYSHHYMHSQLKHNSALATCMQTLNATTCPLSSFVRESGIYWRPVLQLHP